MYANYIENRTVHTPTAMTKYQRYYSRVPSFVGNTPYIFGTSVVVVEEVRGPKGSLDAPRGSIGRFVGVSGCSKLFFRDLRLNTVAQDRVRPLNELALVRSSLLSAVASVDSATQTLSKAALPPPTQTQSPTRPPVATIDLPLGARVEVQWVSKGNNSLPTTWYKGTAVDVRTYASGRHRHFLAYDGFVDEQFLHNFASSDFEWRLLDTTAAPLGTGPTLPSAPGPVTRARRAAAARSLTESVLEQVPTSLHAEAFNSAVFQALGVTGEAYTCDTAADLDAARLRLAADACDLVSIGQPIYMLPACDVSPECKKASQGTIDIKTPTGTMQLIVPATARQVMMFDQRDHWLAADDKALQALLAFKGSRLVPVAIPRAAGLPIVPCFTMRWIKVNAATQDFETLNGYKSRHCVAGNRQGPMLIAAGVNTGRIETSSSVVDDITVKMTIADAAMSDHDLAKADVPNAYLHGARQERPITYMDLPATLDHLRADDGSQLCVKLGVPCWGEEAAGYEWAQARDKILVANGWRPAEGVPDLWLFNTPMGKCRLLIVVDDLFFSEDKALKQTVSKQLCAILSEAYGDVRYEIEPTSFKGYFIRRDRLACLIQLTFPQKINEAMRSHLPELIDGGDVKLPAGKALQKLADSMVLAPPRPGKLAAAQMPMQQLIVSLKFIELLHPRIALILHRLSCVMSNPPPEAYYIARAALASVFGERFVGIAYGSAGLSGGERLSGAIAAHIDMSEPAGLDLEAHADAPWGDRNLYGIVLLYGGGAVLHQCKKVGLLVDCTMEVEAVAPPVRPPRWLPMRVRWGVPSAHRAMALRSLALTTLQTSASEMGRGLHRNPSTSLGATTSLCSVLRPATLLSATWATHRWPPTSSPSGSRRLSSSSACATSPIRGCTLCNVAEDPVFSIDRYVYSWTVNGRIDAA